jgi:hypothetical protein
VEASQSYTERAGAIQERLGTALLHVVRAQTEPEKVRAATQEQLASLVVAAVRTEALADRLTLLAAIESFPEDTTAAATEPTAWPDIPMSYLIAADLILAAVFFGGLLLTARSRETKALAQIRHDQDRWVYRMAA